MVSPSGQELDSFICRGDLRRFGKEVLIEVVECYHPS